MKKLYREYIKFFFFLAVVVVLTPYLMSIIARSWSTELMKDIGNAIKVIDPSGTSVFIMFVIGFYIGSAILLFIDRKKRIQALILIAGVIILFNYMSKNFTVGWNVIYIGLGVAIGIFLGSGFKINARGEFRNAASNVGKFSVVYAGISLMILYSSLDVDNSNFIKDALTMLIFSYFFGVLMNYDIKGPKIFILGPEQSGKTLFVAGCYKRVLDTTSTKPNCSSDLIELTKALHKGWPPRTKDIKDYQFTYEIGKLFPREILFRAVDYPGIYLRDIANYMDNKENIDAMEDNEKKIRVMAAREVMQADILVFIIDASRHPDFEKMGLADRHGFEEMGIDYYLEIVTKLHNNGKDVRHYMVVTKSDLFKEEFPNYEEDYNGFRTFIENKFSGNMFVKNLLIGAYNTMFYPVFYYTKKMENPDVGDKKKYIYIPIRDPYGNMHTYGFDKFIDQLIEDV